MPPMLNMVAVGAAAVVTQIAVMARWVVQVSLVRVEEVEVTVMAV